jgi:hypothetical protein
MLRGKQFVQDHWGHPRVPLFDNLPADKQLKFAAKDARHFIEEMKKQNSELSSVEIGALA